jgi:hypothetical protein
VTPQQVTVNSEIQPLLADASPDPESIIDAVNDAVCVTCPHPWSNHDQIAVRYCTASASSGHSRGCVCTGKEIR